MQQELRFDDSVVDFPAAAFEPPPPPPPRATASSFASEETLAAACCRTAATQEARCNSKARRASACGPSSASERIREKTCATALRADMPETRVQSHMESNAYWRVTSAACTILPEECRSTALKKRWRAARGSRRIGAFAMSWRSLAASSLLTAAKEDSVCAFVWTKECSFASSTGDGT